MSVSSIQSVGDSWAAIELWLGDNAPDILVVLNDGADDAAIATAEAKLQVKLPPDFKESLEIHNGQAGQSIGFVEASEFLSLERIIAEWNVWKGLLDSGDFDGITSEPTGPIKNDWWNPKWIPFTYDGSGNHLCIDLDPAPGGAVGQIITMWHDDPERSVIAVSFKAWLNHVAHSLQCGDYVYSDDYGGIVPKDDI